MLRDCKNVTLTLGHYCPRIEKVSLELTVKHFNLLAMKIRVTSFTAVLHPTFLFGGVFYIAHEILSHLMITSHFINVHQHSVRSSFSHAGSFTRKSQSRAIYNRAILLSCPLVKYVIHLLLSYCS